MRTFGARATLSSTPLRNQPIVATATALASRKMPPRSEEHTSELQSQSNLVCRLLLEKKKKLDITWRTQLVVISGADQVWELTTVLNNIVMATKIGIMIPVLLYEKLTDTMRLQTDVD